MISNAKMIPAVRLATHEIEDLVKTRSREAKLKRLQQVREQSSQFAKNIRDARDAKKEKVLKLMEADLKKKVQSEIKTMVQEMEEQVLEGLTKLGSAHARAQQENEENYDCIRQEESAKNRRKAQQLGKDALKELKKQKQQNLAEKNKRTLLRKQALDTESVRSNYVASLPPVKVLASEPVKEDQPKVIRFDKSTLFQTEYVIKEKVVEPIKSPQDARKAAVLCEIENQELAQKKEAMELENTKKILKRGREALVKEKSHSNYLRLLEQLDKMEKEPDKNWDVESTLTSNEQSSFSSSPRTTSPHVSGTACTSELFKETVKASNNHSVCVVPRSQATERETYRSDFFEEDLIPVRDFPLRLTSHAPPLSEKNAQQLSEIGQLLKELKEEQDRWIQADEATIEPKVLSKASSSSVSSTPRSTSGSTSESPTGSTTDEVVLYSDDDVQIRFDVSEKSTDSSESQSRKNLANILNAIRKERGQLDSYLETKQPIKRPGILRRPASLPDSCTSTPLAASSTNAARIRSHERPTQEDPRKRVLKHYIEKLLHMKREEVRELSVSSSSATSTLLSTPKPLARSIPSSCRPVPTTPEGAEWSKRTESTSSSSAYDSPAGEQSSSKISNGSSLPLGAEASAYRQSETGKWDSNGLFSLGPLLDVYNDVYQAYNQRLRLMAEERRTPQQTLPWQETATESSFMSLTLSATSTERSGVSRQPVSGFPGEGSSFSVELSLSSSSSGNSSQPASVREWEKISAKSGSGSSSTFSDFKSSHSSSSSSQDISMPDVDEALRRLGLPSMQSVLRR